jgi:uncharacterized protein YjcR
MNIYGQLIIEIGSPKKIAQALNCSVATVHRWKHEPINLRWIKKLEEASKYKLRRQLLRPDLYGQGKAAEHLPT